MRCQRGWFGLAGSLYAAERLPPWPGATTPPRARRGPGRRAARRSVPLVHFSKPPRAWRGAQMGVPQHGRRGYWPRRALRNTASRVAYLLTCAGHTPHRKGCPTHHRRKRITHPPHAQGQRPRTSNRARDAPHQTSLPTVLGTARQRRRCRGFAREAVRRPTIISHAPVPRTPTQICRQAVHAKGASR